MSIVQVPGGFLYPPLLQWNPTFDIDNEPSWQDYIMNSGTRQIAIIFRAPKSGVLERFDFLIGDVVTQTPTNGLKVSFQNVSNGEPNGTSTYFRNVPSGNIFASDQCIPGVITDDGTDNGNKKTIERGELLACVIEFESFTTGDSLEMRHCTQATYAAKGAYLLTADNVGSWTTQPGIPILTLVYEGEDFVPMIDTAGLYDIGRSLISQSLLNDEGGLAFTLDAPARVGGVYITVKSEEDFTLKLYDAEANEILESISIDLDEHYPNSDSVDTILIRFSEPDRLLQPNQIYILSVTPGGTGILTIYTLFVWDTPYMAALPGGSDWHYRRRSNDGDWLIDNSARPMFGLHITGIDHDTSGGSGGPGWEGDP